MITQYHSLCIYLSTQHEQIDQVEHHLLNVKKILHFLANTKLTDT
jgi:hypothetical protein